VNIYGPAGLRQLIRKSLDLTSVLLAGAYAVHPLLPPGSDPSAPCTKETYTSTRLLAGTSQPMTKVYGTRSSEGNGKGGKGWRVSAGPILRRGTSNSLSQVKIDPHLSAVAGISLARTCTSSPT